jgi:CDP-6-deoxy-D-xylo-4-hexulose-3-dehydrase
VKNEQEELLRKQAIDAAIAYYQHAHGNKKPFTPGDRIPYAGRVFDEKEISSLIDSSLDFWLTTGRYADKFEKEFAAFLGVQHCSLVNSGSSANLLAFMALTSPKLGDRRIKPGDEVITVAAAFPTTVAPIIQYGAVPVFVDVSLPTYNIDVTQLDAALSDRTKAIMVAHTLGNPFDIAAVKTFCDRHNLWLIEDNCDALGSRYVREDAWKIGGSDAQMLGGLATPQSLEASNSHDSNGLAKPPSLQASNALNAQYTGTFGHIGTSSFYPPHHMTMGEGGAVYTNHTELKRIVESLRDWGRDCWCPSGKDNTCSNRFGQQFGELPFGYDHKYVYSHFGYNLKVTDMQAAIGCAQLEKLPGFIEARKKNWKLLRDGLAGVGNKFILPEATANSDPSWFGFLLTVREGSGLTRDKVVNHLESKGIQTRMLFAGNLIKHPCFDEMRATGKGFRVITNTNASNHLNIQASNPLPITDRIMNDTFWIGVYPGMTEEMVEYMIQQFMHLMEK